MKRVSVIVLSLILIATVLVCSGCSTSAAEPEYCYSCKGYGLCKSCNATGACEYCYGAGYIYDGRYRERCSCGLGWCMDCKGNGICPYCFGSGLE